MNALLAMVTVVVRVVAEVNRGHRLPPTCDSEVYCHGPLLHAVQTAGIFADSKTFVDMSMLREPELIVDEFRRLLATNNGTLTKQQVTAFVHSNFASEQELDAWLPTDYNPTPAFLASIDDDEMREFAGEIVAIWPKLARRLSASVRAHPSRHSILLVPHGIIVPGGRFRESYYWDTYWIVKGLLVSGMRTTARGLLENFVHLVKAYGFIPNGGRVYYTRRSQPPLFTSMCMEYVEATGEVAWLHRNIAHVEREVLHWHSSKVPVGKHMLARYLPRSDGPRAESYAEDYRLAVRLAPRKRTQLYADLKAGAESGWDFSSRWVFADAAGHSNLSYIHTGRVLPVDLNAYLAKSYFDLAHFYGILGNTAKRAYWQAEYAAMKRAIREIFWNATDGTWYDYDLRLRRHRVSFYVSNLSPLWAGVEQHDESVHDRIYDYLHRNEVFDYLGGTPASVQRTGEQWDSPNAWAPLQDIVITALRRGNARSQKMAARLAHLWLAANAIGFHESGLLFEKYDAFVPGKQGGGGEYIVQAGFGWTNGLALDLIKRYFTRTTTN